MTQLLRLSPRYEAIRRTVERFGQVTSSQVRRLHFTTGTQMGRKNRCQVSLQRLVELGFLDHAARPKGGWQGGSGEYVFIIPRRRRPRPDWHTLDIVELYVRLTEVTTLIFRPEYFAHQRYGGLLLKPDGYIQIGVKKYWLEMDESSWYPGKLNEKMKSYLSVFERWERDKDGKIPGVLWVCHDEPRKDEIQSVIHKTSEPDLFRVVLFEDAVKFMVG